MSDNEKLGRKLDEWRSDVRLAADAAESARYGDDSSPDRQSGVALASIAKSLAVLAGIAVELLDDELS